MYLDTYGLDFIITEDGPVLLEINSGPSLTVHTYYFNDEKEYYTQSVNRGYFQAMSLINIFNDNEDIEGITIYFEKGENDLQINTIEKTLKEHNIPVEIVDEKPEGKLKHKKGWLKFGKLGCEPNLAKILGDKILTKNIIKDLDIKTPSQTVFKYNEDSRFPNLVKKPVSDSQGKGIRFYKNSKINGEFVKQHVDGDFYESFIESIPLKERLIHKGKGELVSEKLNGDYVYDIRITLALYNKKWYPFFELKRIAEKPLPQKLNEGIVNEYHYSYLTNLSQGSTIGFLEKDLKEQLIEKSIKIMEYITYQKNINKTKNVFWTGGQSSTYRIINLLNSGYTVKPFYLNFPLNGEKGVAERVITINKLYNSLITKYGNKLLPVEYVYEDDINYNISRSIKREFDFLDKKFITLLNYAKQTNDYYEICSPLLGTNKDILSKYLNNFGEHKNHSLDIFKHITFPNYRIDKLNTYVLLFYIGLENFIDQTWDCDNPKQGEVCKKCIKCEERMVKLKNTGLELRSLKDSKDKK